MPDTAGVLIVDKPISWTSFDVVGFVRRRSGVKRVGHTGTLDPLATGVLPVCIGQATRLVEYLVEATKTYVADVTLGVVTDTYDAEGAVLRRFDASHLTQSDIEAVLATFRGEFEQTPPAYSAIKRDGVPLYRLARRGEVVEAPPRRVNVERLELLEFGSVELTHPLTGSGRAEEISSRPDKDNALDDTLLVRLEVDCSKGFYVRSLAYDLGKRLGVGGMLSGLVRTRVGAFRLEDAVGIEALTDAFARGDWRDILLAPDELLLEWQAAIVAEKTAARLRHGQTVRFEGAISSTADRCRAYTTDGGFVGVLSAAGEGIWRPEKVIG